MMQIGQLFHSLCQLVMSALIFFRLVKEPSNVQGYCMAIFLVLIFRNLKCGKKWYETKNCSVYSE